MALTIFTLNIKYIKLKFVCLLNEKIIEKNNRKISRRKKGDTTETFLKRNVYKYNYISILNGSLTLFY